MFARTLAELGCATRLEQQRRERVAEAEAMPLRIDDPAIRTDECELQRSIVTRECVERAQNHIAAFALVETADEEKALAIASVQCPDGCGRRQRKGVIDVQ